MDDVQATVYSLCALVLLLGVLAFFRVLLRKGGPLWRVVRIGFFIERVPERAEEAEDERPEEAEDTLVKRS